MRLHTLASVIALTALAPAISQAADGSITINGRIVTNTCTISSGAAGKHAVTLPTVSTSALSTPNAVAGLTPVTISLTGCTPASGKVALYFEPGADTDMGNGYLKNGTATGSNVEIQLLNADKSAIALNLPKANQNSQEVNLSSGAANLTYFAQYIAPTTPATAGDVTASTAFTVIYP